MTRTLLLSAAGLVLVLGTVLGVNTLRLGSRQLAVPPAPSLGVEDAARLTSTLAEAIRCQTVADADDASRNAAEFEKLQALLVARFPRVHAHLERETVAGTSLLYTWRGSDATARPIALMAHQDVVPVAPGTESAWKAPPFAGVVRDGYVWGRGAWDDKANLVAQLEAVEGLLASGFRPRRTVYLVFGADEEVGGLRGAAQIAALLRDRQVRLDFVLDEGLLVTEGVMPGLAAPAALVGVAEKGYLSIALETSATPGHSSMPSPRGTGAIAKMSAALRRLEDEPLPARIDGVAREMFETLAPEIGGAQRVVLSNLWLFGPWVATQLEKSASSNAVLRTTTALTVVRAGDKENVLPGRASAVVNFRLLPGDTRESVLRHVRKAVGEGVEITVLPGSSEASPVSPTTSEGYRLIERTVRALFPGTIVAPGLMVGATDSRRFAGLSDRIYRFSPVRARAEDLARFHGTDERIAVANLIELAGFYRRLLADGAGPPR